VLLASSHLHLYRWTAVPVGRRTVRPVPTRRRRHGRAGV